MHVGLSQLWSTHQASLFPSFESKEVESETTSQHRRLILILDSLSGFIGREVAFLPESTRGRRPLDRFSFVAAFLAMKILNIATVKALVDRLKVDSVLRRICKFENVPCEATFSNAFRSFAEYKLAEEVHKEFINKTLSEDLAHNVSRDSTSIEAREKPKKKERKKVAPKQKRGRPRKGEKRPQKPKKRLEKQLEMTLEEMVQELPSTCDKGGKKDAKGNTHYWHGYKLHIDTIEGDIPVSAILTSASTHDSQVAIPLEEMTSQRISSLYSLMDAAYDAPQIKQYVTNKGKVPIIDHNPRSGIKVPMDPPKQTRYKARSSAERVNSHLKDNFGGRNIRYRGNSKIMCHLSFGLLAIAAEQVLKLL